MEVGKLILEFLKVLIWPVVTTLIVFLFRDEIVSIFSRLSKLKLPGGAEIELLIEQKLQVLEEKVDVKLVKVTDATKVAVRYGTGGKSRVNPHDPNKGQFGKSNERNDRKLSATVVSVTSSKDWFSVNLKVESTTDSKPLSGKVKFHLHPTFLKPIVEVEAIDGIASLSIVAWGAFTVGVEGDNGVTRLELDLAEIETAPIEFKLR